MACVTMVKSDEALRELINGGRVAVAAPKRRQKIVVGTARGPWQRIVAIAGGLAMIAVVAVVSTSGSEPETHRAGVAAVDRAPDAVAAAGDALATGAIRDGGQVRLVTPTPLGGHAPKAAARPAPEPLRYARRDPAPLRAPQAEAALSADLSLAEPRVAALGTAHAAADGDLPDGQPAAIVVAGNNLVWTRLFGEAGQTYTAAAVADAALWSEGACAKRPVPAFPAYCDLDLTVYAPTDAPLDRLQTLALAREIGTHVQASLGLALPPLTGEDRLRQTFCFAGLWAGLDQTAQRRLSPDLVEAALRAGHGAGDWSRGRFRAFRQGIESDALMDCADPDLAQIAGTRTK